MNIIVAVDKNWGIGKNNKLLVSIPSDMKFFRNETNGKVVVMGRKTLESFPNGIPELLEELKKYPDDQIYVIGGGKVYEELLPYCNVAHVTKIDFAFEADTYFPDLDKMEEWQITATSDEQTYFDLEYSFVKYERIRK